MNQFDPAENSNKRIENLLKLEETATEMSNAGEDPLKVVDYVNTGSKTIAANYPDIPEYEKAVSAAGLYKQKKAADAPQETLDQIPFA